MRNWQTKQNKGGLPDSISADRYGAGELNTGLVELETSVSRTGQTLAGPDGTTPTAPDNQLAKALFINGAGASTMQDNGSANTYELTPVTGSNGLMVPDDYDHFNGGAVLFIPGNPNAGASTLNIGQTIGTLLGSKKLLDITGADLASGVLETTKYQLAIYDSTADTGTGAFILIASFPVGPQSVSSTVVQIVQTQTGAVATGSTNANYDDTIPQITEGDEYMTLAITPTSATNRLKIDVVFNGALNVVNTLVVALFQDSTADALAASGSNENPNASANELRNIKFTHDMVAGTTSSTTFRVRAGRSGGSGTVTFNGATNTRRYGGVMASSIIITEYTP